ncbi:hypothetical protein K488DRAFT_90817 [Vararia minispora EC-137]|uniref:Uncharacterized protein n=1 Tax=Vararia minispora EC-137 TaxID=1314806 RepID=A0ACB8Q727_9AGAM|nr:hypothetical protein K488DRAFT_90817 [Vararia minispora EC-137]
MALGRLPNIPESYRQTLLLIAIRLLLVFQSSTPFPQVVAVLCALPVFDNAWPLDRFLSLVAKETRDAGYARILAPLAMRAIRTLNERQLHISPPTYLLLVRNKFIVAELGKHLRIHQGGPPTLEELIYLTRYKHRAGHVKQALRHQFHLHLKSGVSSDAPRHIVEYLHGLLDKTAVEQIQALRPADIQHLHQQLRIPDRPSAWLGTLQALALRRLKVSVETLLAWFYQPRRHTKNIIAYTILWRGLNARRAFDVTIREFEAWSSRGHTRLDRPALRAIIQACSYAGKPTRAVQLIKQVHSRGQIVGMAKTRQVVLPDGSLATEIISKLASHLLETRRYGAVFGLWDHMRSAFGTAPDGNMLAVVLIAARIVPSDVWSPADALRSTLDDIGLFKYESEPRDLADIRSEAYAALCDVMETNRTSNRWRGVARVRALAVFEHHLFAEYPKLRHVDGPVLVPSDRWSPVGVARRLVFRQRAPPPPDLALDLPPRLITASGTERSVINDASLRAYIHLLGPSRQQARVLAWAHELGFAEKKTVGYSVIYFARALTIEAGAGFTRGGEYEQLKTWVQAWAGDVLDLRQRSIEVEAMRKKAAWRQGFGR